jgi:hypothetical protein
MRARARTRVRVRVYTCNDNSTGRETNKRRVKRQTKAHNESSG